MCDKRAFGSKDAARRAMMTMHQSVRVYRCDACGKYHVTKSRYTKDPSSRGRRGKMGSKRNRETDV